MTWLILLWACGGGGLSEEALRDPQSCAECHPSHVEEWQGSMHAYAADDPVFLAMNRRGQEETGGELGDFCVRCHAPVAVELGLTTDGLNLDELDQSVKGVTCYFCHSVDGVEGTHNNPLTLGLPGIFRGGIKSPVQPGAHMAEYSPLFDRNQLESSDMCGSCHDIVTPNGTHIERTYTEWQDSLYATSNSAFKLTCGACHMRGRDDVAASVDGVPVRRVHDHSMAGVDLALTDWPDRDRQQALVQSSLDSTVRTSLCVQAVGGLGLASVTLENVGAGHNFPSGASAERRVWVELNAYDAAGQLGFSTGVIAADESVMDVDDANLWVLNDTLVDDIGNPVHMFWEAHGIERRSLVAPEQGGATDSTSTHQSRNFVIPDFEPARVTLAVHLRPLGFDLLDDLILSGHLDPGIRSENKTMTLAGTVLEWTPEAGDTVGDMTCVQ